jgi:hypothetical protein
MFCVDSLLSSSSCWIWAAVLQTFVGVALVVVEACEVEDFWSVLGLSDAAVAAELDCGAVDWAAVSAEAAGGDCDAAC